MDAVLFQVALMKGIRTLYSDSDEQTAQLLYYLASEESNKGNHIAINEKYVEEHAQVKIFF
jgi:ERCC4-type nuclease